MVRPTLSLAISEVVREGLSEEEDECSAYSGPVSSLEGSLARPEKQGSLKRP
jgi:hypothetical protein